MATKRQGPSLFQRKLKELAKQRKELLAARVQVNTMEEVYLSVDAKFRNFLSGEASRYGTNIYLQNLTKAGDAAPLLRALAAKGYRLSKGAEVLKEDLRIDWTMFRVREDGGDHYVWIRGYLDPGSVTCKKVQIGAKVETIPIFEMRCEGPSQDVFNAVAASSEEAGVPIEEIPQETPL